MKTSRPHIEVAAGVIFRGGKLLITQRPLEAHLGGRWEFPGGKREAGETFEQCLHRELLEELGVEVVIHELLESVTHDYPEKSVTLQFYRCSWKANEPRAIGCPALRWVNSSDLESHQFPEADIKLVELLKSRPEFWT